MQTVDTYIKQVNIRNAIRGNLRKTLLLLSFFVILGVFWGLKLTGITMAGEAFCGNSEHIHTESCVVKELICETEESEEHQHSEECYQLSNLCSLEEHTHMASCYSDIKADIETENTWKQLIDKLELSDDISKNIVAIAKSQVGYTESTLNFQVDEMGVQHGITRYGQWYGNPYGEWSAMFVGFCLNYSGATDLPINAGAQSMLLDWEQKGLYVAKANYNPSVGNLIFLDKNKNGSADAMAIIEDVTDNEILVIEGDIDNSVAETSYQIDDGIILGFGRIFEEPQLEFKAVEGAKLIAQTEKNSEELFTNGNHLVVYWAEDDGYYALTGNGDIVAVKIDENGKIFTDFEKPELLIWNVTVEDSTDNYVIQNLITEMYLPQAGVSTFATTYSTRAVDSAQSTTGAYQYARAVDYSVWLDGTNGGLMSYYHAHNQRYTVVGGSSFKLPETWQSTSKYNYTLRGWYDVINNVYYLPGAEVTVNGNMVFYADWVASSYDIGRYNSQVADTISTNEFITTRMFDYGVLFNVLSSSANVTASSSGHSETWNLIKSGNSPYSGEPTLNYIFRDWDVGNRDISYPNGVTSPSANSPTDTGNVYSGLYNDRIGNLLFNPDTEVIGKQYLGTADHLFQLNSDPTDEHYGYYYYDSELNAASYNQSDKRFYVYEYLSRTTDSSATDDVDKYSDFLPLNSPYENTNGKTPTIYSYDGNNGEYVGVNHYMYDSKENNANNVATNFFFGMSVDIDFYLPNAPGFGGNQDVYGKDMHFKFSGDDDVWVFVDGKMVLDLGGIHGQESGDVNFSSGEVTINGVRDNTLTNTLKSIGAGEHVLTLYYMERGSSKSNCAIYFNLAPRFSFSIQKEDVLTKEVLNGAQFSVYTDKECTQPAELWTSKTSYNNGEPSTNVFTVTDGTANMWGMGSGNTYYIKETKPPDNIDYTYANGIICLTLDKQGTASYSVEIIDDGSAGVSGGFTVHGFRINEETQRAFIVATNAPKWVEETTGIWAHKKWNDNLNHDGETITVYLTVTDADGTVRRLQEAQLSSDNEWKHQWKNLPKYAEDGVTPIKYGIEEAYVSGYYSKAEETNSFTVTTTKWLTTNSLQNGTDYILKTANGYLSSQNTDSDTGFMWVSEETAKSSPLALWTVTASGNTYKLTNGANQAITFYYNGGSSGYPTDFFARIGGETTASKQYLKYRTVNNGIRLYYDGADNRDYYLISSMTSANKFNYSTSSSNALLFTPVSKSQTTTTEQIEGLAYEITNTPLDKETSLTVYKHWDYGFSDNTSEHEKAEVTVKLLANGKYTGRTVTLSLKNNWHDTFRGLPYEDESGNLINYSVEEQWDNPDWIPKYDEIITTDGDPPYYTTNITNIYRWGNGVLLPATGSYARLLFILSGGCIILISLVYGIVSRSKRERRTK